MNKSEKKYSLEKLYKDVNSILKNNLSVFSGMIIRGVSIERKLTSNSKYENHFTKGYSKFSNNDYKITLSIPNELIEECNKKNGDTSKESAKYDIRIKSLFVTRLGEIVINIDDIRLTGVSDRELLKKRLHEYALKNGYYERTKKDLPRVVTSILALTSKSSEIDSDIISNLNIKDNRIDIKKCANSFEVSKHIKDASLEEYDIVVLYRGGREDEAMNKIFSSEEILDAIVKSNIPVCVALGHEIDTPFVYRIADKTYSTPSEFAKEISLHNKKAKGELDETFKNFKNIFSNIQSIKEDMTSYRMEKIEVSSKSLSESSYTKIVNLISDIENNSELLEKNKIKKNSTNVEFFNRNLLSNSFF
jgi:exonuclease VII large subunit